MKVYGNTRWRSFRVIWCLEELGLDYEIVDVMPRSPEIRAVNPLGQVPALDDNGTIVTDSTAILHYLADRRECLTYRPGTGDRARLDARIAFLLTEVEAPLWMAAKHSYVLPPERRLANIKPTLRQDFADAERKLATLLGDAPFLSGDVFTIADIIAGHLALWAEAAKFDLTERRVIAYIDRLRSRDAYRRTQSL